jgi:formylglycine-generating enzyme required for sulfatase activity
VVHVSWDDAMGFCQWASQANGRHVSLPSEAAWEKAARGTDGRIWPWGNQPPDEARCNFDLNVGDTTPVGRYCPQGDSPYGYADMSGNVWQWTNSIFKGYPYDAQDGRESLKIRDHRVLRGGSFAYDQWSARCAYRL